MNRPLRLLVLWLQLTVATFAGQPPEASEPKLPSGAFARLGSLSHWIDHGTSAASWSPDSKKIAVLDRNHTLIVLDALSGKEQFRYEAARDVFAVQWTTDGKELITFGPKRLDITTLSTGNRRSIATGEMSASQTSICKNLALLVNADAAVVVDMSAERVTFRLPISDDEYYTELKEGTAFLTVAYKDSIKVYDLEKADSNPVVTLPFTDEIKNLSLSKSGKRLVVYSNNHLFQWDVPSGRLISKEKLSADVTWFEPLSESSENASPILYSAKDELGFHWLQVRGVGQSKQKVKWHYDFFQLSPNEQFALDHRSGSRLAIADLSTGRTVTELQRRQAYISTARKKPLVCMYSEGNVVDVWDVQKATLHRRFAFPTGVVMSVAINSAGSLLAVGESEQVTVWEIATGMLVKKLAFNGLRPTVEFTPLDSFLMAKSNGRGSLVHDILAVWDVRNWSDVSTIIPDAKNGYGFAVAPTERHVATWPYPETEDDEGARTVTIWHVRSGNPVAQYTEDYSAVGRALFTCLGQRLVVFSHDTASNAKTRIVSWDLLTGEKVWDKTWDYFVLRAHESILEAPAVYQASAGLGRNGLNGSVHINFNAVTGGILSHSTTRTWTYGYMPGCEVKLVQEPYRLPLLRRESLPSLVEKTTASKNGPALWPDLGDSTARAGGAIHSFLRHPDQILDVSWEKAADQLPKVRQYAKAYEQLSSDIFEERIEAQRVLIQGKEALSWLEYKLTQDERALGELKNRLKEALQRSCDTKMEEASKRQLARMAFVLANGKSERHQTRCTELARRTEGTDVGFYFRAALDILSSQKHDSEKELSPGATTHGR